MKRLVIPVLLFLLVACTDEDMACISIGNSTSLPIYTLPYVEEYTNGEWIQPGSINEFYTVNNDELDGYEYFSYYYDSLVVYIKGHEENPVKLYSDGRVVNYDPELNPFTNPEVWKVRETGVIISESVFNSFEEKKMVEHFFRLYTMNIPSLADSIAAKSNPDQ